MSCRTPRRGEQSGGSCALLVDSSDRGALIGFLLLRCQSEEEEEIISDEEGTQSGSGSSDSQTHPRFHTLVSSWGGRNSSAETSGVCTMFPSRQLFMRVIVEIKVERS